MKTDTVKKFAELMQYKLDKNQHKECEVMNYDKEGRRWDICSIDWLGMRMLEEMVEMQKAILDRKPPKEIAEECADIANFAMMIADNINGLNK